MLEAIQQVVFWPGDTIIGWLQTSHPQGAVWLGVSTARPAGLISALLSGLVGWGLFSGLCHLSLLIVQCWERWHARRRIDAPAAATETDTI